MAKRGGGGTRRIERLVFADGSFMEGSITQLASPAERQTGLDYRLAYVAADGTVLVLYDNQGRHPPHRHVLGRREPYQFAGVDRLVDDSLTDVAHLRGS
jgi:hypothetical protein